MIIPYAIETLEQEKPIANWIIIGACAVVFIVGLLPGSLTNNLVLDGLNPIGLIGHLFLHGSLIHLIGNMIFLWVFGNAICSNTNNIIYPILYLGVGISAAFIHLVFDGSPAIGASGAINGITGIVLAVYPTNRVRLIWFAIIRAGTTVARAWIIITVWLLFDIIWLIIGAEGVAYWAHIGGLAAGVVIGLLCLQKGWILTTDADNKTLLEIIKGTKRGNTPR